MDRAKGIGGTENHGNRWKGGRIICGNRARIKIPGHPRANKNGYVSESVLVAEDVFGKPLPLKAIVHHVDGNPLNNSTSNLVICEDRAFHGLLHIRIKAYQATGNPNMRKCPYCKEWDEIKNLYLHSGMNTYAHSRCTNGK